MVVPGVSDRDIPVIEMDLKPVRVTKKPRSVPQYKSAQWDKFSEFLADELNRLSPDISLNSPLDTDPNLLWERFRDTIITGMNKFIWSATMYCASSSMASEAGCHVSLS